MLCGCSMLCVAEHPRVLCNAFCVRGVLESTAAGRRRDEDEDDVGVRDGIGEAGGGLEVLRRLCWYPCLVRGDTDTKSKNAHNKRNTRITLGSGKVYVSFVARCACR